MHVSNQLPYLAPLNYYHQALKIISWPFCSPIYTYWIATSTPLPAHPHKISFEKSLLPIMIFYLRLFCHSATHRCSLRVVQVSCILLLVHVLLTWRIWMSFSILYRALYWSRQREGLLYNIGIFSVRV